MYRTVFDIDGTLTVQCDHRAVLAQNKQWDEYHKAFWLDDPNWEVIQIAQTVAHPVFITGATHDNYSARELFLGYHDLKGQLIMRQRGDYRPNEVLKQKIMCALWPDMKEREKVKLYDDNPRACESVAHAGFKVARVFPSGYIEQWS